MPSHIYDNFDYNFFNSILDKYKTIANNFLFFKIKTIVFLYVVIYDRDVLYIDFDNGFQVQMKLQFYEKIYEICMERIKDYISNREDKLKNIHTKNDALLNCKNEDLEIRTWCDYILTET